MKWLQLGNARNMLMTVNIKLSIIVIAEIIPSTDDTCLHQSISPQNGPSKVPNSTPANHQRESIASILPVISTIIATVCRTRRHTQLTNLRGYHVAATWRYRGYHVEEATSKRRDFVESWLRRRHVFHHVYTTL